MKCDICELRESCVKDYEHNFTIGGKEIDILKNYKFN